MNRTILILLSFYALTFALKESSLFDRVRIWMIGLSPFFYRLFECYFCVGFWSGIAIYFIANWSFAWSGFDIILWGLAGSGVSYVGNVIVDRLSR